MDNAMFMRKMQSVIDIHSANITQLELSIRELLAIPIEQRTEQTRARLMKYKQKLRVAAIKQRIRKSALAKRLKTNSRVFDRYHVNNPDNLKQELPTAKLQIVPLKIKSLPRLQSEIKRTSQAINLSLLLANKQHRKAVVTPLIAHIKLLKRHIQLAIYMQH